MSGKTLAVCLFSIVFALLVACGGSSHKSTQTTGGAFTQVPGGHDELLPVVTATENIDSWKIYKDGFGIVSFRYPHVVDIDVSKSDTYDGATVFHVRLITNEKWQASFMITRYGSSSERSLELMSRAELGDNDKTLVFGTCPFTMKTGECLELTDQTSWMNKYDLLPIQIKYFMRFGRMLYGVALNQEATFDITQGIGPQILSTIELKPE